VRIVCCLLRSRLKAVMYGYYFSFALQLTQLDIPHFEEKCKNSATKFFRKFGIWRSRYAADIIATARDQNPSLFSNENRDFKVEIVNKNDIILVGLLPNFTKTRTSLMNTLQKLVDEKK